MVWGNLQAASVIFWPQYFYRNNMQCYSRKEGHYSSSFEYCSLLIAPDNNLQVSSYLQTSWILDLKLRKASQLWELNIWGKYNQSFSKASAHQQKCQKMKLNSLLIIQSSYFSQLLFWKSLPTISLKTIL